MLEEFIFLHLIPGSVIEKFEFPGESENNHQTREVHHNDCKQVPQNEEREVGHEGWNTYPEAENNDDDDEEEEEEEEEEAEEDLVTSINNPQL